MMTRTTERSPLDHVMGVLGLVALIALHFLLRPWFTGPVHVDVLLIALVFAVVGMRPGVAVLIGLLFGVSIDALTPASFGAGMLAMVLVAYGIAVVTRAFFERAPVLLAGLVFAGKLLFALVYVVFSSAGAGVAAMLSLLGWSILSAIATAGTALLLRLTFRPTERRTVR